MATTDNAHVVRIVEAMIYWYKRALSAEAELRELKGGNDRE